MSGQPLKAGDKVRVVGALGRSKSPNLGLIVTVGHRQLGAHGMDHTQHGAIVRCHHPDIVIYDDMGAPIRAGYGDFAVAWLEKIEPDTPPPVATTTDREVTA